MKQRRLLIISNNVLATTRNNGKTILSYFDCIPKEQVYQLYFSPEDPAVHGYQYFQLSDRDVLRGWLFPSKRGREIKCLRQNEGNRGAANALKEVNIPKGLTFRMLREVLWLGHWKSKQLLAWLDKVNPTAIFFVGGDCGFAYNISRFIANRYDAKFTLYITDDYVIPYSEDSMLLKIRKYILRRKVRECLLQADCFYTVSGPMRHAYLQLFGRDSFLAVNMPESLKSDHIYEKNEQITLLYAGSLYYGRDEVLGRIADALSKYNDSTVGKRAMMHVYTNVMPNEETKKLIEKSGAARCCGSIGPENLKIALNKADILVFVESFDEDQVRKTRFSLSTKIPEYLSVGKPILAVGPRGIGSMDYLEDCAMCIFDRSKVEMSVGSFVGQLCELAEEGKKAEDKFERYHKKEKNQRDMVGHIFGENS